MFSLLVLAGLLQTAPLDTAEVYAAVLKDLRADHPALPVVLAETRSGVACMPHCGAQLRDPDESAASAPPASGSEVHSAAIIRRLTERQLIQGSCSVDEGTFGCAGYRGHVFVGLGSVEESPVLGPPRVEGAFWVKTAVLRPCATVRGADEKCTVPEAVGWWFLVLPSASGGEWNVVRRLPAFAI